MVIYFIQGKESKNWKIGYTGGVPMIRINEVMKELGRMENMRLMGIMEGGLDKEIEIHNIFKEYKREQGKDFFNDSQKIIDYVEKNCVSISEYNGLSIVYDKSKRPKKIARKLIRVGASIGVTIPKKLLKKYNAQIGDWLKFRPIDFIKVIKNKMDKNDESN